jgi:hypothetical protein
MYFAFIYESKRNCSKNGEEWRGGRTMEVVNLRYIVNTYVNITVYSPIQPLCANKN